MQTRGMSKEAADYVTNRVLSVIVFLFFAILGIFATTFMMILTAMYRMFWGSKKDES